MKEAGWSLRCPPVPTVPLSTCRNSPTTALGKTPSPTPGEVDLQACTGAEPRDRARDLLQQLIPEAVGGESVVEPAGSLVGVVLTVQHCKWKAREVRLQLSRGRTQCVQRACTEQHPGKRNGAQRTTRSAPGVHFEEAAALVALGQDWRLPGLRGRQGKKGTTTPLGSKRSRAPGRSVKRGEGARGAWSRRWQQVRVHRDAKEPQRSPRGVP